MDGFETMNRFVVFGGKETITSSAILSHCALRWDFADLQKSGICSLLVLFAASDFYLCQVLLLRHNQAAKIILNRIV